MIFQPTNIYPSQTGGLGNGVIDATQDLPVSWQVNGNSAMTKFKIDIYRNDTQSVMVYTTGVLTDGCPFYGTDYTGNINLFEYVIPHANFVYQRSVAYTSTTINDVQVVWSTFLTAISSAIGTYTFSYDGTDWKLNSTTVSLATYGISFYGTATSGDTITIIYRNDESASILCNDGEYKLLITQYWGTSNYITQISASSFITRDTPTLAINEITTPVTSAQLTIEATYSQTQGDELNWIRWRFAIKENGSYTEIDDTGNIYGTSELKYACDGLFSGNTYAVNCFVQTENGIEVGTGWTEFTVLYDSEEIYGTLETVCNNSVNGVKLNPTGVFNIPSESTYSPLSYSNSLLTILGSSTNNLPTNITWTGMTYGQRKYYIVGYGALYSSSDGRLWHNVPLPVTHNWSSIAYTSGSSLDRDGFVIIANDSNDSLFSTDGVNWEIKEIDFSGSYNWSVVKPSTYGFIALSGNNTTKYAEIITPFQEIAGGTMGWGVYDFPSAAIWTDVVSDSNGRAKNVVISGGTTKVLYKSDLTWVEQTISGITPKCVGYDGPNNRFFIVGQNSNVIAYSALASLGTWTTSTLPVTANWSTVVCDASHQYNLIISSNDTKSLMFSGTTWTQGTLPASNAWFTGAFGQEGWIVASNTSPYVVWSSNGISWSNSVQNFVQWNTVNDNKMQLNQPFNVAWRGKQGANGEVIKIQDDGNYNFLEGPAIDDNTNGRLIAYGNGIYVVLTSYGTVFVSNDLEHWTKSSMPYISSENNTWNCLVFGNGKFVASTWKTNYVFYSTDGITWTASQFFSIPMENVVMGFANGVFCINIYNSRLLYSVDAITWNSVSYNNIIGTKMVTYGNSIYTWHANSVTYQLVKISPTNLWSVGVNFYELPFLPSRGINSIACSDSLCAILTRNALYYTNDLSTFSTWIHGVLPTASSSSCELYYNNGSFFYISENFIYASNNLTKWNIISDVSIPNRSINTVRQDRYMYLITNKKNLMQISSPRSASIEMSGGGGSGTWERTTLSSSIHVDDIVYGNNMFVAIGSNNGNSCLVVSNNGIDFTPVESPFSNTGFSILKFVNNKFFCVNSNGLAYSNNGINWTKIPNNLPITSIDWSGLAYGNGKYVLVDGDANCLYSTDGITWTQATMAEMTKCSSLAFGNGKFVAFPDGDESLLMAYSSDGISWTTQTIEGMESLFFPQGFALTFFNNKFIAVTRGDGTKFVFTSSDGVNWTYTEDETIYGYTFGSFASDDTTLYLIGFIYGLVEETYNFIMSTQDGITWSVDSTSLPHGSDDSTYQYIAIGDIVRVISGGGSTIYRKATAGSISLSINGAVVDSKTVSSGSDVSIVLKDDGADFTVDGTNANTLSGNINMGVINQVRLGANQVCDYIYVSNGYMSSATKNSILTDMTYHPTEEPRYLMADFDYGTAAGSIESGSLTGVAYYRATTGKPLLEHIMDADLDAQSIYDLTTTSGNEYTYYMFGISPTSFVSSAISSNAVNPYYWNWALYSCTQDEAGVYHAQKTFLFEGNISSGAVGNNNNPTISQNFTRYPTIQTSPSNYRSGTLSSLIGLVGADGKYSDSITLRDAITDLATTTNTLFIKNRKGDFIKVRPSSAITMATSDNSANQAQTMEFPWVEVGSSSEDNVVITSNDGAWID